MIDKKSVAAHVKPKQVPLHPTMRVIDRATLEKMEGNEYRKSLDESNDTENDSDDIDPMDMEFQKDILNRIENGTEEIIELDNPMNLQLRDARKDAHKMEKDSADIDPIELAFQKDILNRIEMNTEGVIEPDDPTEEIIELD